MRYLVVNLGSSSLKLAVIDSGSQFYLNPPEPIWSSSISSISDDDKLTFFKNNAPELSTKGIDRIIHRVVHGGAIFTKSVLLTDGAINGISSLSRLAPIHQPRALQMIELSRQLFTQPHFVAFDTAFFAQLPESARTYALPKSVNHMGLRRFGFHGLSHSYSTNRVSALLGATPKRLITVHLGNGSSLAAIKVGTPIHTSMGYTPLDGIVMGTRCGSIDPGIVIELARTFSIIEVEAILSKESGILGLSSKTSDMKELEMLIEAGDPQAKLAYEVFLNSLIRQIGECYALLDGVDCLVFTGGIGENSKRVREDLLRSCTFLPSQILEEISTNSKRASFIIAAREDLEMIRSVESIDFSYQ